MKRLLVLGVFVAGCGGDAGPRGVTATVDTVDGVERWGYPAEPGAELAWAVDTVGVLGDAFAEDVYQFNDVSWQRLASDDEGNLYVLDRQGLRVLKYGPDMEHLATFGRSGEGPGELSQPIGLALGPGDTIWVADFANGRLTGYPQDGGDPRLIPYPDSFGFPSAELVAMDGGFIQSFQQLRGFSGRPGQDADGEETRRFPLIRLGRSLEALDTIWSMPEPPTDMVQLDMGQRRMIMMMPREFTPEFRWQALSDGSVVVSDTASYLLRLIGPDGVVRRVVERGPAPRPVTEEDREAVRQRVRDAEGVGGTRVSIGGSGPDEATRLRMLEERLKKMTFAAVAPRVLGLRVDPLDRIWVGVAGEVADSIARIDIYERDGTLLGELRGVPMPDVFMGDDRIGVLRRDELDIQQLVMLKLSRPQPQS